MRSLDMLNTGSKGKYLNDMIVRKLYLVYRHFRLFIILWPTFTTYILILFWEWSEVDDK